MLTALGIGAVALLLLGFPMWIVFLLLAISGMAWQGVPMEVVVQGITGSINKLVLLSVPGFIFAGGVMGRGSMAARLINWVAAFLGRVPGGMALTTIASAELFGAISGSSSATVAALGRIVYPALLREGYGERFSLGLVTTSGAIAIIIPPSIAMIIFAVITNASVGRLFLAGILPGVVLGVCIATYCIAFSVKNKVAAHRQWRIAEMVRTTREVLWTLGAPVVIAGGIYGGFTTPTEASMAVSVYAVFVSVFIYRDLSWADIWAIMRETALLSSKIFIIVAASAAFSWILTAEQVPQRIVGAIEGLGLTPVLVLLMLNVIVLVVGMFMDPGSAIILFTPLLWPIAQHAGVDLTHFGIIYTVNLAIGMFSPPFGVNIFVSCSIFDKSATEVIGGLTWFFVPYLIALGIITYVPEISLFLPNLLMN
jgi:C4-dicarboxylate transporter DctM subunit